MSSLDSFRNSPKYNDYEYIRRKRMEEMLVKTRAKLRNLVREAYGYEMYHLLTQEEKNQYISKG